MGVLLSLALAAVLGTGRAWGQEEPQQGETRIVRAYFDDPLVAAKAVMSLDALESEYEKGYIVLRATEEDIETARQAGMRIVEDDDYVSVALPSEPPTDVVEGTIAGFPCYRTVEGTYASARAIAHAHPELATWRWAGRSWKKTRKAADGYTMYVLRLTNSETAGRKPALFITAALHAREYTTAELALRFAEYLADSYETDADVQWLLDHQEVHIMLQANPDGRKRAEEGLLWRKNHNTRHCRHTWAGVDLNRNFDFKWGEAGSSTNECSIVYRGLSAASEPETQAVQAYMARLFPDARGPDDDDAAPSRTSGVVLDIHSHGRLVIWPWGHVHDPAPNGRALQTFGRKLAYFNRYRPLQAVGLYPASGTTEDYGYGVLGRASFTYELGTTFFQDCSRFENSILDDNLESLLYAFKVARTPYRTPAGPDVRDLSLSSGASTTGVAAGTAVTLSAIFDDTRYENGNGFEPTQNIAEGEYYVDVPPWARRRGANAMDPSDGAFDSRTESATATIDTTDLAAGRHTVFVRARDSDGNWGAVSAVFLQVAATQPPPPQDDPEVEVSFAAASYEVPEGGSARIALRLSADPERELTIPLLRTHHGGASVADYSGVPDMVMFGPGVTVAEFPFKAADDSEEDSGESIVIGFGPLPPRVTGSGEAKVSILDDDTPPPQDDPEVEVSFAAASYEVPEGGSARIALRLSADPERELTIPLLRTHHGGASVADYSGVPDMVMFGPGVTVAEFPFKAADDSEEDFGESVVIGFGPLPPRVTGSGEATVSILDDDTPPTAAFEVHGAECGVDLCRTRTGNLVRFTDTSGGPVEHRRWNFGDGTESSRPAPEHAWTEPGFFEVTLRVSGGERESSLSRTFLVEAAEPQGTCVPSAETLCLQDSRYAVAAQWRKADGETGAGTVVHAGTNDSGLFTFFSRDNWEILVKVLDGCALNGHVWVYAASTTDVGYIIRVTDTATGLEKEYRNEPGVPASAITDAAAFPDGCRPP